MSWSVSIQSTESGDVGNALREARDRCLEVSQFDAWAPEVEAQQELGIQLAERMIESGALRGEALRVSLSGHAHDGSEHSAADMLTVSASVAPTP